jgi:hypothetical protein
MTYTKPDSEPTRTCNKMQHATNRKKTRQPFQRYPLNLRMPGGQRLKEHKVVGADDKEGRFM